MYKLCYPKLQKQTIKYRNRKYNNNKLYERRINMLYIAMEQRGKSGKSDIEFSARICWTKKIGSQ